MQLVKKDRSRLTAAAAGRIAADLTVENARLVNVFTGEIYGASVDVLDGVVVRVRENGEAAERKASRVVDACGRYLVPGFVDTHLHVESSLMVPEHFGKAVCVWGTTTVVADPHEIANVAGIRGVEFMLESAKKQPVRIFQLAPSCVPSLPGLEESGAVFGAEEIGRLLDREEIPGLGEVMDYYGVADDDPRMHAIVAEADRRGKFVQGHAPGFTGSRLDAYLCGGPRSDHEIRTAAELLARRRAGAYADLRIHSREEARALLGGVDQGLFRDTVSMCTDDVNAYRLERLGSLNRSVADLILEGTDPVVAVRCASLNGAREFGFEDVGAVAPGFAADFQLVDDLAFEKPPRMVFIAGELVAENGAFTGDPGKKAECALGNTVDCPYVRSGDDFRIPAEGKASRRVMVVNDGYGGPVYEELACKGGFAAPDAEQADALNYVCVLSRYGKPNKTVALFRSFGLRRGALATTVSHDSHNIFILYADPDDAFIAVEALKKCGGGVCLAEGGEVKALLELPVAGLMSDLPLAGTAARCAALENAVAEACGLPEFSLPMIIFRTLPVFERYTPTDLGVVDGPRKRFVPHIL